MARYRAEHNQELQGYFVDIPDNPYDPRFNEVAFGIPNSGGTGLTMTQPAATGPGIVGTATQRTTTSGTTYLAKRIRTGFVSLAAAGANAGVEFYTAAAGQPGWLNGTSGYTVKTSGGFAAVSTTMRWILGLSSGLILNLPEPSTILNSIFIGADTTDLNAQLMYNDGAGTATKIDLGPNFPARQIDSCFELELSKTPSSSVWQYFARRLDLGITIEGSISGSNLPSNLIQHSPYFFGNNGAAGGSIGLDSFGFWAGIPL